MTAYMKALDAEMLPIDVAKTRVAILGTLGALHAEPVAYDLACLRSLIEGLEPDLLGVELEPAAWESGDLGTAPLEVRQALLPAARRTDTVVVPLGGPSPRELAPPEGGGLARVRANLMRATDVLLTHFQQIAATPEAVNSSAFSHLCGMVCGVEELMASQAGRDAWDATNRRILERLVGVMRQDPGRRVLVAVQCRRVHWLSAQIRQLSDVAILIPYHQL